MSSKSFFNLPANPNRPSRVKPPTSPAADFSIPPSWAAPKSPSHRHRTSSTSSTSSTTSQKFHPARFPPAEEAALVTASNNIKANANKQFQAANYSQAISTYDRALAECPNYLDYEIAVLQSNIAACHLKLEEWKETIEAATRGLDGLERLDPSVKVKEEGKDKNGDKDPKEAKPVEEEQDNDGVVELPSDTEDDAAALASLALSDAHKADITRIRTKLLLRRARARSSLSLAPTSPSPNDTDTGKTTSSFGAGSSTWSTLTSALDDYTLLTTPALFSALPPSDQRTVVSAMRELPPRIEKAKESEMAEMMGKLKELGNGILKPFGLSTDMFKMTQDPGTGGYSMSFGSGGKEG